MKKAKSILILAVLILAVILFYNFLSGSSRLSDITIVKQDGYKLLVDGKPFVIKGVCYSPVPVGKDYEYNFWGDKNGPWIVDGKLMKDMGVNTVRFYRAGKNPEEVNKVISNLYKKYGIRSLMGNYMGFWNWPPPNYADAEFRQKIKAEVLEMVKHYKDNPGVLMWILGNENNYSFDRDVQRWSNEEIDSMTDPEAQRKAKAKIYYSFVNELAKEIKKIDPRHPVVMGVGEVSSLDSAKENCPDVDVIGMIAYRGPGFGNLFRQVKQKFDRPVVMIEWGADSYSASNREADEPNQAAFLKLQWQDIVRNMSGNKGEGNALGGTLFEWNDEWWKGNENLPHTWTVQDTAGHWQNTSYHYDAYGIDKLNMNEEWWGLVALNPKNKIKGNDQRVPKESYAALKSLWKE